MRKNFLLWMGESGRGDRGIWVIAAVIPKYLSQ